MKNVYLIQPSYTLNKALYLPYTIGTIAAYSFQYAQIQKEYRLCDFIFSIKPLEETLGEIEAPYIAGFSCYIWNIEYNLALAKAVKEKWPDCMIAFGGPQIEDSTEYLEQYDFIDVLMHGEGEVTFYRLLTALSKKQPLSAVDNISYRAQDVPVQTAKSAVKDISDFPSPYTMGLFDSILADPKYAGRQFDTIIETTRGCPYHCMYCCWATVNADWKLHSFSMERVKADLRWMAEHKISFCFCADSNFGILERDMEIARYVAQMKKQYGYPERFETTAVKNKNDVTLQINQILNEVGLNSAISVAVQSMSPAVLEIIGRKNMPNDTFAEQLEAYRKHGMYTYTDIMMALPGETLDSFCRGVFEVIEAGQHTAIQIFRTECLPNTPMRSKEMMEKYGIQTIRSALCQNHSTVGESALTASRSEIIVETNTMSRADWRTANRLSVCVQAFHCLGLLRFIAIYLRKARNISYYDFYMPLFRWIENESSFVKSALDKVCRNVDLFLQEKAMLSFSDPLFGNVFFPLEEGMFLTCITQKDTFFDEVEAFIRSTFGTDDELESLFRYQRTVLVLPKKKKCTVPFAYDWRGYYKNLFDKTVCRPTKAPITVQIGDCDYGSWETYARDVIWYGKRKDRMIEADVR